MQKEYTAVDSLFKKPTPGSDFGISCSLSRGTTNLCVCEITRYPAGCTLLGSRDCSNEYANRGEQRRRGAKLVVL